MQRRFAAIAAVMLVALGAAVLVGWAFDIALLRTIIPHSNAMKANSAAAFVGSGIAVYLLATRKQTTVSIQIAFMFTVLVALLAGLTLLQYIANVNLGVDELLFADPFVAGGRAPGRMSPLASGMFLLATSCILASRTGQVWAHRWFTFATTAGVFVSLLMLLGYVFNIRLGRPSEPVSVAVHVAGGFFILFTAIMSLRGDLGLAARFRSSGAGGVFVRRTIPLVAIAVPIMGWLRLRGEVAGLYDTGFGVALFSAASIGLLTVVSWAAGTQADKSDSVRLKTKIKQQEAVTAFSNQALTIGSIDKLYELAISTVLSMADANYCSILEVDISREQVDGLSLDDSGQFVALSRAMSEYDPKTVLLYALKNGKPIIFPDIAQETRFKFGDEKMQHLRGGLVVPVAGTDNKVRLLCVYYDQPHDFGADEVQFVESIVNVLTVAYERRKTADALSARADQQAALAKFSSEALSATQISDLFSMAVRKACRITGASLSTLAEIDENDGMMSGLSRNAEGEERMISASISTYPDTSILRYVLQTEEPVYYSDIEQETRFTVSEHMKAERRAGLVVRIFTTDRIKRFLAVYYNHPHRFTSEEINFLNSLATVSAVAYERRRAASLLTMRAKQQAALATLSTSALTAKDIPELYKTAITTACSVTSGNFGAMIELDERTNWMKGMNLVDGDKMIPYARSLDVYPESSVLHYVLKHKQTVWFENIDYETRFTVTDSAVNQFKSGVVVQVRGTDNKTRLLCVLYDFPRSFSRDEIEFLESVSNTLAIAQERRRTADQLQIRVNQQNALMAFNADALSILTLPDLSRAALKAAFYGLSAKYGNLAVYNPETDVIESLSLSSDRELVHVERPLTDFAENSVMRHIVTHEQSLRFADISAETNLKFGDGMMHRFKSGLIVPVPGMDDRAWRLSIYDEEVREFSDSEMKFLRSVAGTIAVAYERIRVDEELQQQNMALEKASRAKTDFLAMMSHELRTPMTGLLGMADLLTLTRIDDEQRQMIQRMQRSGRALLDILNDILDLSKLDADKMPIEMIPFQISPMLQDLQHLFMPIAAEKGLELLFLMPPEMQDNVIGDAKRIRQVLTNLLNNATKFTKLGRITVQFEQIINEDDSYLLRFSVADTGIGIAPNTLKHLFKPFMQADASTSRKYGGTGLGLAICQRLVKAMGGVISVSSQEGLGSTFSFTVPVAEDRTTRAQGIPLAELPLRPARRASDAALPYVSSRAYHILLAEDNDTTRMLVTAMLEKAGHRVMAVENGQLAVDAAAAQPFDIVLMDMQMPVMDGPEAIKNIRAHADMQRRNLPIIAFTADIVSEHRTEYLGAGANALVAKPVHWPTLFSEIERLLAPQPRAAAG